MKRTTIFKRLFTLASALVLTFVAVFILVACNSKKKGSSEDIQNRMAILNDTKPEPIYYEKENDYLFYSDDYFRHRASTYNEHLATLSMYMAKYSMNPGDPKSTTDYEWYRNQPLRLAEFYKLIGFGSQLFNDDYTSRTGFNTIGIGCASRKVKEGNNEFTVIACTVRSGGYFLEWENNVFLGDGSKSDMMHEGWYNAANKVIDFIGYYIDMLKRNHRLETEQIKLWMSGYSRGGAVMNIAGGLLDNKLGKDDSKTRYNIFNGVNLKREDIMVYTFESPQGANLNSTTVEKPKNELYNNIFNILNPNDLVTKVAMSRFGFTRFGIDKFITTEFFDPETFAANRYTTISLAKSRESGINWNVDNFQMYGIKMSDLIVEASSYTSITGLIYKWITDGGLAPDVISEDGKKVHYDANIVLDILIDRAMDSMGNRDTYCNCFQNFARKVMYYMFNDCPDEEILSWKELLIMTALQGVGYSLFPGIEVFVDFALEDLTGATSTDVKYALLLAADLFLEYPSEVISMVENIGDVFDNHSTQINVYHAQAQDSYYIDMYNEKHEEKINKVPYRNNSELVRIECIDINQGEIHKDGETVIKVNGYDVGSSDIETCYPGYAVGYYNYATYERTEWFLPACYALSYGFYEHSLDVWHQVRISKYTYRTNQNYNRTGVTWVDEYFNCDAGPFTGSFDADVEPESSQLSDLTNSRWMINASSGLSIGTLVTKNIKFKSNGKASTEFKVTLHMEDVLHFAIEIYYGDKKVASSTSRSFNKLEWVDDDYRIIDITGGPDATDKELINWLYSNATRIG